MQLQCNYFDRAGLSMAFACVDRTASKVSSIKFYYGKQDMPTGNKCLKQVGTSFSFIYIT